jgi:hypothetical protein
MMALRLIVFHSIEMLSKFDRENRRFQTQASRSNFVLSQALLTGIVDVARRFSTDLQFACLFLEIGRQIEPNLLAYLFPLPPSQSALPLHSLSSGQPCNAYLATQKFFYRFAAQTVTDLFNICVDAGSLQASSSYLPLFSSRSLSQRYISLLLERATKAYIDNIHVDARNFDRTVEERRVIGDLFRFGVRVEDAFAMDNVRRGTELKERTDEKMYGTLSESVPHLSLGGSDYFSTDDEGDSEQYQRSSSMSSLVCVRGEGRRGSLLSVFGSIFEGHTSKRSQEDARRAASLFIERKRALASINLLNYSSGEDADSVSSSHDDECSSDSTWKSISESNKAAPAAKSVAGVLGEAILNMLRSPGTGHRWTSLASLTRISVQPSAPFPSVSVLAEAINQLGCAEMEALLLSLSDEDDVEDSNILERFIIVENKRCDLQLRSTEDASCIFYLSLVLLDRLIDTHGCSQDVLSALVLIGFVTSYCSGRGAAVVESLGEANYLVRSLGKHLS